MSSQQQFEQLLQQMMSDDNKTRKQAENIFNKTRKAQPNPILQALLQVGRSASDENLRGFAIVILRRTIIEGEAKLWNKMTAQTQALLKRELLAGVEQEQSKVVRMNLCEAIFEVAADLFEGTRPTPPIVPQKLPANAPWTELLDWLLRIAQSDVPSHRESAVEILGKLSIYLVDVIKNVDQFRVIRDLLAATLTDKTALQVRLAALSAATNFIQTFQDPEPRALLRDLMPLMLDTIAVALNEDAHAEAESALKLFIELVDLDPGFLKAHAVLVTGAMIKIAGSNDLEDGLRQLAIEFLVTFAENKPQLCREIPNFAKNVVEVLLGMMMDSEEVDLTKWNESLESAGQGNQAALDTYNDDIAQEAIDRLSCALLGDVVAPVLFDHIPKLLADKRWQARHTALMAMSMIFEGATDFLLGHLDQVMGFILPACQDNHPRVRWAAANAIGQISTDYGPKVQRLFHKEIAERLCQLLGDTANVKVQAHACAAAINFCEKIDRALLEQYLPPLLGQLFKTMQVSHKVVQEQAITAVASVAGAAGKTFTPFYDNFMPFLKQIMVQVTAPDMRMLRCKAIECVSLIGVAVGKERFLADSAQVMTVLASVQTSNLDAEDPTRDFILQAWTRISSTLGRDFEQFLPHVMPPVFETASMMADVQITDLREDDDEDDDDDGVDPDGWETVVAGDKKIRIHTTALEEKATACNLLFCYASEMKSAFFPYVETAARIITPLLDFYYHDGVRMSAMSAVPHLINSVKLYRSEHNQDQSPAVELYNHLFPLLIDAVRKEMDPEVAAVGLECIHETLNVMGGNILTNDQVKEMLRLMKAFIFASGKRREDALNAQPDGDGDDAKIVREEVGKEDDLLREVAEVFGVLVREHPQGFMAAYDEVHELLLQLLQRTRSPAERQLAVCIFDDIVEHAKEGAHRLYDTYIPFLLEYSQDQHRGLRQSCTFGLGCLVKNGPSQIDSILPQIVDALTKVITAPGAREGLNAPPAENALSSFAKVILHRPQAIQSKLPDMIDAFVNWLPAEVDVVEARVVHAQLLDFLKLHSGAVFGPNYKNLPKLLSIFGRILETPVVTEETAAEIYVFLAQLQKALPAELLNAAFAAISQDEQARLRRQPSLPSSPAK